MTTRIDELYETDFYTWTKEQAKALRALEVTRPNAPIDWPHLILEVLDLGKEQRNALRSWTTRIIEHLLKLEHSPATAPRRGWTEEITGFRQEIRNRITPALRRDLTTRLPRLYREARTDLVSTLRRLGEASDADRLPEACPYTLDQLLETSWWPAERQG